MKAFLEHQQRHEWAGREIRDSLVELMGSTMGIVGYGTVGHAIAERARAFGIASSPSTSSRRTNPIRAYRSSASRT